jgi:hypothetical protein
MTGGGPSGSGSVDRRQQPAGPWDGGAQPAHTQQPALGSARGVLQAPMSRPPTCALPQHQVVLSPAPDSEGLAVEKLLHHILARLARVGDWAWWVLLVRESIRA